MEKKLNPLKEAKKYNIPVFLHPQIFFLEIGFLILAIDFFSFSLLTKAFQTEIVIFLIFFFTLILLILSFLATKTLETLLELNRLKSEFLEIVIHHLRAPLTSLTWGLDYLFTKEVETKKLEVIKKMKEKVEGMQKLIRDLLVVLKLEVSEKKEKFYLKDIVSECLKEVEEKIKEKRIKVFLDLEEIEVFSERENLKIVIHNLISNAVFYNKNEGEISIKAKKVKGGIVFSVKDTGIGIPQKDQKMIFQKFFRGSNAKEIPGTGLGLYVSKEIVERLGGKIWFKSKEGKGSQFSFFLPKKYG
jgi:signal transduction histidine kinase